MIGQVRRCIPLLLICASAACGPSPAHPGNGAPTGTLVVVIRQGPDRVPFQPKVARIQRANQQLAELLGHSIQIELDGALFPQTHEDTQDVIARLVEDVVRDLDGLQKENKKALDFARTHFERLVVRYAPAEAAQREDPWRRFTGGKLDPSSKTIDVTRPEARWHALGRGEIATVIHRAFVAGNDARYANVLPDALPREEQRGWFEYHAHGTGAGPNRRGDKEEGYIGSVNGPRVRGMVMLHGLALRANDAELVKDVRAWLVKASSDFASTYHNQAADVEGAPASSPYRQAESAYMSWLRFELPRMTTEERGEIARHLFVIDFRKESSARDRFATYAFPGIDPMSFSFEVVDAWIAAGHPTEGKDSKDYFDRIVCPAKVETTNGQTRYSHTSSCEGYFYRWALADRAREDDLAKALVARNDAPFTTATFYNARRTLRDENDYLRFLRRFERAAEIWKVGADVHREVTYRPSTALLEESRRWWREVPAARGHAFFWFTRNIDGSYRPETDWPDLLQGSPADEAALNAYLDLGWEAFELLPVAWAGVAKNGGRLRAVTTHARLLYGTSIQVRPGGRSVSGTLAALARVLCEQRSMGELAELRTFAQTELAKRPGAGLSEVIEATDPAQCAATKPRVGPPRKATKPPPKNNPPPPPRLKDGDWIDR